MRLLKQALHMGHGLQNHTKLMEINSYLAVTIRTERKFLTVSLFVRKSLFNEMRNDTRLPVHQYPINSK